MGKRLTPVLFAGLLLWALPAAGQSPPRLSWRVCGQDSLALVGSAADWQGSQHLVSADYPLVWQGRGGLQSGSHRWLNGDSLVAQGDTRVVFYVPLASHRLPTVVSENLPIYNKPTGVPVQRPRPEPQAGENLWLLLLGLALTALVRLRGAETFRLFIRWGGKTGQAKQEELLESTRPFGLMATLLQLGLAAVVGAAFAGPWVLLGRSAEAWWVALCFFAALVGKYWFIRLLAGLYAFPNFRRVYYHSFFRPLWWFAFFFGLFTWLYREALGGTVQLPGWASVTMLLVLGAFIVAQMYVTLRRKLPSVPAFSIITYLCSTEVLPPICLVLLTVNP